MLRSAVLAIALLIGAAQGAVWARDPGDLPSILQNKAETIRVKLVDAVTGQALSGVDIEVRSDNGIRCCCAPCPINEQKWYGKPDAQGYVEIPGTIVQYATRVSTSTHYGDLIKDSERAADGSWVLGLRQKPKP